MRAVLSRSSLMAVLGALAMALFLALAVYTSPVQAQGQNTGVCHIPPGNPEEAHFIPNSDPSFPAHEAHGDPVTTPEECEDIATTTTTDTTAPTTTDTTAPTTTGATPTGATTGATTT